MNNNPSIKFFLILALFAVTLWAGAGFIQTLLFSETSPRTVAPRGELANFEKASINLFKTVSPSVAYIYPFRQSRDFRGRRQSQGGTGSGFVWDKAGHVITNHHVVKGASQVFVRLDSGKAVPARVIGRSPDHDLAVLKVSVPPGKLTPILIGRSSTLQIGQSVFAIGNPFGLSRTLTTGIVSALNRDLPTSSGREITGVVQTDAAINPGNSGGPLLDSAGRLIGVNTAIASPSGSSAGIGFAVPVDTVNRIVPQLIKNGRAERPGIGIFAEPEGVAANYGIRGVIVAGVRPNGAAQKAGLRGHTRNTFGDIIVAIDGKPIHNVSELTQVLDKLGVGANATFTIIRNNRRLTLDILIEDIG